MPPVDEATFIAKADLLIAAIQLLAVRLDAVSVGLEDFKVSSSLNVAQLAARIERVGETVEATASQMNGLETARIKRIPRRHGSQDGAL